MHHQPGFSALREVGSRRGRVPNPRTPQHTENQLTKGAGPRAHSARGISWRGEGPSGPASRSPGTIGPGRGCAPPQVYELILLSSHLCSCRARGARGEGSASRESKDGGKSRPCIANPSHLPKAFPVRICFCASPASFLFCKPELALAEFTICKLGRRRCYKPKEGRSLAKAGGGVGDARVAGRAPGPGPTGIPHLLARFSRSPSAPYLAFADLS